MYNESAYALGANRSSIRDLFEYGRARAGVVGEDKVYDYSLGNPSIPAPAQVNETIRALLEDTPPMALHGYTSAIGDLATRQAIADDLNARYDAGVTPEELFIGCGAAPELCAVFRALAFPGAEILAIAPFFPEYGPFVTQAGATFKVVPPDVPDFQINMEQVEKMLSPNTAAIIVNSPNNPTGTVYTRQTLERLADLLEKKSEEYGHPIYIVSDEPYRELVYGDVSVPYLPAIYPNTIICYSYSKSLSLPGQRIGYVLVPKAARDSKAIYAAVAGASRALGHVCAPSLWQKVIARCAHLRPDLSSYEKNRKALYEGLLEAGFQVAKPDGAFYLFVKVPDGDANAFMEKAKKLDVLVVPGDPFGCPGYVRMCYCVKYQTIVDSLPLLKQLAK